MRIGEVDGVGLFVQEGNIGNTSTKSSADLFSHQLNQGLQVELTRQRVADRVDRSQFCGTALGLVKQARIVQSYAHGVREGCQESDVCLTEGVLPIDILKSHRSLHFVVRDQGNKDC